MQSVHVLLIEDSELQTHLVECQLSTLGSVRFEVTNLATPRCLNCPAVFLLLARLQSAATIEGIDRVSQAKLARGLFP